MNALIDWNPVRELDEFENRILRAFRPEGGRNGNGGGSPAKTEWVPPVNVEEDENEYVITAELPEVKRDDVKVMLENGVLALRGERKAEKQEKNRRYHLVERSYGTFERSFRLPGDADPQKVKAEFKEGMLTIRVSKSEAARPKQIEVRIG